MMRFMDIPTLWRQIMMAADFLCFAAASASCAVFIKKRRRLYATVSIFCGILGYCCLQVMADVARRFALNLTREGIAGQITELPAGVVLPCFFLFVLLSAVMTVPTVKLLKTEWTFPHFSKLKVHLHDTFGLSIVATKAYYDGQDVDRDTVRMMYAKCRECFTDKDPFKCRTYESIYGIGKLIGVSLNVKGVLPEDERVKPIVCAALSECMINTFSHAWGDAVYADITDGDRTVIVISNNGKAPKTEITEKGGLKHLRELIEEKGGSMVINSIPQFSLTFSLPKEETK